MVPGRPARAHRTDRTLQIAGRVHDPPGQPAHRRGTPRRRTHRRPHGTPGDPGAARTLAALPRAATLAHRDLLPGRRARARGLVPQPRTPAPDDPVTAAGLRRTRHGRPTRTGAARPTGT